jgi:hypothetical protein
MWPALRRWAWLVFLGWSLAVVFHGCHSHDEDLLVLVRVQAGAVSPGR